MWPWLWCRPAAIAPIGPLAWEFPYASGVALKERKGKKGKKKKKELGEFPSWLSGKESGDTSSNPGFAQWVKDLALT